MINEQLSETSKMIFVFLHEYHIRYGVNISEIDDQVVLVNDSYPETMDTVYKI